MKNKIIATLVAFGLVGSASAIEVNDNLSINGFIDGSYQKTDNSAAANTENLGLDEIANQIMIIVENSAKRGYYSAVIGNPWNRKISTVKGESSGNPLVEPG